MGPFEWGWVLVGTAVILRLAFSYHLYSNLSAADGPPFDYPARLY